MREDLGLVGAAWIKARRDQRQTILERLKKAGAKLETKPSLRFVLTWETDTNDVDLHIYSKRAHVSSWDPMDPRGGRLYANVTTGYGTECFAVPRAKRAPKYTLQAHYRRRGPMGYGIGKLQIIEHDGRGGLRFEERPYVAMKDGATVDLGVVKRW